MSAKLKIQLKKLFTLILIWMLLGVIFALVDHFTLNSHFSAGTAGDYTLGGSLLFQVSAALLGAILGGIFLIFFVNERYRDRPYIHGIIAVFIAFIVITTFITGVLGLIAAPIQTGKPLSDPATQEALWEVYTNPIHIKNVLLWSIVVGMTQFLLHINDKFGQGVLWDFVRGKYHSPRVETRIFMFVDLKSSTTIAEELGNEKYHELLRDFYADVTNAIIYNKGEVYQYVGDEVVISWHLHNGVEDNHCVKCYFDMRASIVKRSEKYERKYGLVPDFKAGLHYGEVMAGEIGIIKRDITYSGDVLNTTARIQSQCNEHKVKILASNQLLRLLSLEHYKQKGIGEILLRGKGKKVGLSTVEQA